MTPEHIVIQMTDGTEFAAMVHVESGKLHVSAGGFLGMTFVLEPNSILSVARRILEMLNDYEGKCPQCGRPRDL